MPGYTRDSVYYPERGGLPKVVSLEGNAQDDMESQYGKDTREIPHWSGRTWSTNVTGRWVSPLPGDALLGEASALSIEGNCSLIASPFINGVAAGETNTTFDHVLSWRNHCPLASTLKCRTTMRRDSVPSM